MRLKRTAVLALVLLVAGSCARTPVSDDVTIEFFEGEDTVQVTAVTEFQRESDVAAARSRTDAARAAALAGTDPWSVRFARLDPQVERFSLERRRGKLESVTRTIVIPTRDLQQVFADTNITMNVIRGDGWSELSMFPGTSARATREQQRRFNDELSSWSHLVGRYFTAVHHAYSYMDDNPGRAEYVFAALLDPDESPVTEEEEPLVAAVTSAMENIAERMEQQEGRAYTFGEDADMIFNPFPARMVIRVPGTILATEGFAKSSAERELVIEPVDLFAAITSLEGRWITPDPMAALLRDQTPTGAQLAELERRSSSVVNASEIETAIREQLARPRQYVVRWRE